MKKLLLVIISMAFLAARGQELGTIELNEDLAATLKFNDDILPGGFCTLGNNPQIDQQQVGDNIIPIFKFYDVFVNGNTVMFKLTDSQRRGGVMPNKMTLTIKLNDGTLFNGYIMIAANPSKSFYDFTFGKKKKSDEQKVKDSLDVVQKGAKERLATVLSMADVYIHMGAFSSGITYQVANIYNDNKYSYYKINIKNTTSNDYTIDDIVFRYDDQMKKKVRKKEVEKIKRLVPFVEIVPKKINAYSTVTLGYAIPLFSTTARGFLDIKFLEKNGNRNADIMIKAWDLQHVRIFDNDLNQ